MLGAHGVVLFYLQFADDSLLFGEAQEAEICNLKRILRCFELISGLRINYHKILVCGVGVQEDIIVSFADTLNCRTKSLSFLYLGLPLGANPNRKATWKPVLDKLKSRLAGWKRRLLSFASRLTLIKAVTSSLPIYYLSLFKMPEGVATEFGKLQARFLWGGSELKKKLHIVKWEEISKSVEQGRLGIKRVREVNDSLLIKW